MARLAFTTSLKRRDAASSRLTVIEMPNPHAPVTGQNYLLHCAVYDFEHWLSRRGYTNQRPPEQRSLGLGGLTNETYSASCTGVI
jgi:hypothetical protein